MQYSAEAAHGVTVSFLLFSFADSKKSITFAPIKARTHEA